MADVIKLAVRDYAAAVAINRPPVNAQEFRQGANRRAFPEKPKPVFKGR
jgi:hypothetical protein